MQDGHRRTNDTIELVAPFDSGEKLRICRVSERFSSAYDLCIHHVHRRIHLKIHEVADADVAVRNFWAFPAYFRVPRGGVRKPFG